MNVSISHILTTYSGQDFEIHLRNVDADVFGTDESLYPKILAALIEDGIFVPIDCNGNKDCEWEYTAYFVDEKDNVIADVISVDCLDPWCDGSWSALGPIEQAQYLAIIQNYDRCGSVKPQKHIFVAESPEAALQHVIDLLGRKESFEEYEAESVSPDDTIRMSREQMQKGYLQSLCEDYCVLLVDGTFNVIHEQE